MIFYPSALSPETADYGALDVMPPSQRMINASNDALFLLSLLEMSQDNAITCNFPKQNFFNQTFVASPFGVDCKSFPSGSIFPSLMTKKSMIPTISKTKACMIIDNTLQIQI